MAEPPSRDGKQENINSFNLNRIFSEEVTRPPEIGENGSAACDEFRDDEDGAGSRRFPEFRWQVFPQDYGFLHEFLSSLLETWRQVFFSADQNLVMASCRAS
jgi:hypothetical protein